MSKTIKPKLEDAEYGEEDFQYVRFNPDGSFKTDSDEDAFGNNYTGQSIEKLYEGRGCNFFVGSVKSDYDYSEGSDDN